MNETYVEILIKKKTPAYMKLLKILLIMLTVCFVLVGLILWPALLIGVVLGVASYFVYMNAELEYEYLYLDKELTVDKIMAKSKRKRVEVFELEKMEIIAPIHSWHLDSYKNRNDKIFDYSSGEPGKPDTRYVFFYDGQKKVIFEPNENLIKAMQFAAPRKVFKD